MDLNERQIIDLLVNEFWRLGYFTLSRRFGTYLPEPANIGEFKVDVVARLRDKFAVGIILSRHDLNDVNLIERISYLASRQSKSNKKPVALLIGVPTEYYKLIREKLSFIDSDLRKNIKLVKITENKNSDILKSKDPSEVLFS